MTWGTHIASRVYTAMSLKCVITGTEIPQPYASLGRTTARALPDVRKSRGHNNIETIAFPLSCTIVSVQDADPMYESKVLPKQHHAMSNTQPTVDSKPTAFSFEGYLQTYPPIIYNDWKFPTPVKWQCDIIPTNLNSACSSMPGTEDCQCWATFHILNYHCYTYGYVRASDFWTGVMHSILDITNPPNQERSRN